MSRRRKLEKFAELLGFPNVYETTGPGNEVLQKSGFDTTIMSGQWRQTAFKHDGPITLELACGRGEYTLQLARKFPERNFIGVDIKGARIWKGARTALQEGLSNVAFLRIRIEYLHIYFEPDEIEEIWITFPDPFRNKENRRLTAPNFILSYRKILSGGGRIHLKTDDFDLFDYSRQIIRQDDSCQIIYQSEDIYKRPLYSDELAFKTYYENKHLADKKSIKYLVFTTNN